MATSAKRKPGRPAQKKITRQPFGGPRLKLQVNVDDHPKLRGFHVCWVNESQLEDYKLGGYAFVSSDELTIDVGEKDIGHGNTDAGFNVSLTTSRRTGEKSYLMKLPEKFHKQDQDALEGENQKVDDSLQGGLIDDIDPGKRQIRDGHGMAVRNRG